MMVGMASTQDSRDDLPAADIAWLQDVLGASPLRVSILRFASRADGAFTARMVIGVVGGSRSAVGDHLQALTKAGVLRHDFRLQERTGRGSESQWTWQPEVLSEGLRKILELLETPPVASVD
jgi:hypothetical protein